MKLTILILGLAALTGCAALGEIAQEIPHIDATQEIAAVSTLTADVVNKPWDNFLQIGLGYALALLRRWYKKKKGAKQL